VGQEIVIVEDEASIAANYCDALRRAGYQVRHYADRQQALQGCTSHLPDLAILDVGLGSEVEGGFDLCRELRAMAPLLPIIFLTARDSELDAISGLRLGADDYLTKDISLAHLCARVVALFRRTEALKRVQAEDQLLQRGALELNLDQMRARWRSEPLDLTVTEFWILHSLARQPGHVKSRQQLMDAANIYLDDNTVTSHIKRIRKKFLQHDPNFDSIQTAYGMGYRWVSG
jgi:two-component system, OmpR family, response regulator